MPFSPLCCSSVDVANPMAPARRASRTRRRISAISAVGGGALRRVVAEHERPHRGVADERGHVGHHAAPLQRVEILRIGLEVPAHARPQRLERHALDVGEVAQREVAIVGPARGDREAAVADDDRGHAERGGRRGERVPGELGVVVRVDVHDAGRQREAARVHALAGGAEVARRPRRCGRPSTARPPGARGPPRPSTMTASSITRSCTARLLAVHDEAAVDAQRLARHVAGARRGEEADDGGDVFGAFHPPQRHRLLTLAGELFRRLV